MKRTTYRLTARNADGVSCNDPATLGDEHGRTFYARAAADEARDNVAAELRMLAAEGDARFADVEVEVIEEDEDLEEGHYEIGDEMFYVSEGATYVTKSPDLAGVALYRKIDALPEGATYVVPGPSNEDILAEIEATAVEAIHNAEDARRRARKVQIQRYGTVPACCENGECGRCRVEIDRIVAEDADSIECQCGGAIGEACAWAGPLAETVVVEWMPEHLRDDHTNARNRGRYPYNGARRLRVAKDCAQDLIEGSPEWVSLVGEARDTGRGAEIIISGDCEYWGADNAEDAVRAAERLAVLVRAAYPDADVRVDRTTRYSVVVNCDDDDCENTRGDRIRGEVDEIWRRSL